MHIYISQKKHYFLEKKEDQVDAVVPLAPAPQTTSGVTPEHVYTIKKFQLSSLHPFYKARGINARRAHAVIRRNQMLRALEMRQRTASNSLGALTAYKNLAPSPTARTPHTHSRCSKSSGILYAIIGQQPAVYLRARECERGMHIPEEHM